jgi:GAF domain-containing protein
MENGTIPSWKTPGGHRRAQLGDVMKLVSPAAAPARGKSARPLAPEFRARAGSGMALPPDEDRRLEALHRTGLVDSKPERAYDRLTWLATRIADTPISLITLLTAERQWFKSRIGIEAQQTPREWAFCSLAILQREPTVVTDALEDPRFQHNPLVTGEPYIRFYAGFPLATMAGLRLGTLCVIDRRPRSLTHDQMIALGELAQIASEEIERTLS